MRALIASAALVLSVLNANAEYRQISPGPTLDYALAYCDNAAMVMPQQGYGMFGSPEVTLGYAIGRNIRRVVEQSRFKENCMVMNGWKWLPNDQPAAPVRRNYNTGG